MTRFIFFLCIFITLPALASQSSIVIMPFEKGSPDTAYEHLDEGLPEIIKACFSSESEDFQILERQDFEKVTDELGKRFDHGMVMDSLPKLQQIIIADYLMHGSYLIETDESLSLSIHLYHLKDTSLATSANIKSALSDIDNICQQLSEKVYLKLKAAAPSAALETEERPEENQRLLKAVGYYYNKSYHQAIPELMKILRENPDHEYAETLLLKSYQAVGLDIYHQNTD